MIDWELQDTRFQKIAQDVHHVLALGKDGSPPG